jgi:uroporphyrinogen-III decarboxylase
MTDKQWQNLLLIIKGEILTPLPAGFIIDSPWLPNWAGITILDYFSSDALWLEANMKVLQTFPDIIFLPGFWSEYGMCTEPSAFGARSNFPANEFPHAHKMIRSSSEISDMPVPNPRTDGLLPFMLNRLRLTRPKIEDAGHKIRFAVARGPLNIASYLMGSAEFLTLMMMEPEHAHRLIQKITQFLKDWLNFQIETFPTIDGILLLDDIIGFIGDEEFRTFGLPYLKALYSADVSVKFLHNDAPCEVSVPYLPEIGVNLFNMGFEVSLNQLKEATGNTVTMLGNIPPRDVLAAGTVDDVQKAARQLLDGLKDRSRVLFSCGGGMPPNVSSENIRAFIDALQM